MREIKERNEVKFQKVAKNKAFLEEKFQNE